MTLAGKNRDFEFQRLHGMGEGLHERLEQEEGYRCRTYASVRGHRDLLAYLVRRLLEHSGNSSFVHQLPDTDKSDADRLADLVGRIEAIGGEPDPSITLPTTQFSQARAEQQREEKECVRK